jgi:signal transduction histidine kinase
MTGYSEKEILKMNVYKIIQERHNGTGFKIPLKPVTYETQAIKKDGTKIFVEVQESAIEYEGKMIRALVIRNISKRMLIEKQLREERLMRLSWVIDGQEIERQRLARELHDGLGQSLIALKLKLESVEVEDVKNQKKLEDLRKLFNKTIDEIRRISYDLMPAGLNEFGIVNAMQRLCNEIEDHTNIKIDFEADKNIEKTNLSEKCSMYLYRITQESINNSVKHAEASVISVNILKIENFIVLSIADNGKGFKFEATHKYVGNGIYNMRERVNMLGGTFEVNSEPEKGTEVIVKIPLNCY